MAWMIVSEDSDSGPQIRADRAVMDAHWAYELSIRELILAAGSLRADDGITPCGSLLIVDVPTRREARELLDADPATQAGLRGRVTIRFWNPALLSRAVVT